MADLPLWPWGVFLISLLSFLLGWILHTLFASRNREKLQRIIQSQENEYVKLAQKHVEQSKRQQENIGELQERLEVMRSQNQKFSNMLAQTQSSSKEDASLIQDLKGEIDRLKIENSKLTDVPQSLYIEKNNALKSENEALIADVDSLLVAKAKYKKRLRKLRKRIARLKAREPLVQEVRVIESIDWKKLKKVLRNLPMKKSTTISKPKKKRASKEK